MKDLMITRKCVFCGKPHSVEVDSYEYNLWDNGALIQNAMPNEPAEVREFLISGICPTCQKECFDEFEDEEEEEDEEKEYMQIDFDDVEEGENSDDWDDFLSGLDD